jgi:hypothetical protein
LFLQRLPRELRVLLGDKTLEEPRDIGEPADKKWALHSHQHGGSVAAVEAVEDDGQVAAVKQQAGRARGKGLAVDGAAEAPPAATNGLEMQ